MSNNFAEIIFWTVQLSLFIAKIFGFNDISWWAVLSPTIILFTLVIILFIFGLIYMKVKS